MTPGVPVRAVVVGVGSTLRRDDGLGPAVLDALRGRRLPAGVRLLAWDGDPAALLDAWAGVELAVVVDAAVRDGDPGRAPAVTSSHGLGLAEAVALGGALGRLPKRLVVHAVEVPDVGPGPGSSDAARAAVPVVAAAVLADLRAVPADLAAVPADLAAVPADLDTLPAGPDALPRLR